MAFAIVEPNTVGGFEIVAHVEVGRAIAVEVAEGGRQTPVIGRLVQRTAIFIDKSSVSPGEGRKTAFAIVVVEDMRLAVFIVNESDALFPLNDVENKTIGQIGIRQGPAIDGVDNCSAI